MTKAVMRKRGASLVIVDEEGLEALRTVPDGRDVMVEFKRSRNPRHHRLLFALLNLCVERLDAFPTTDLALTALKIGCGHFDAFIDKESGRSFYVPRSISFAAMDQTSFAKFFDDAIQLIATRWAPPGTTPESIRREIIEACDGPQALQRRA
jgi:hypothetical protein